MDWINIIDNIATSTDYSVITKYALFCQINSILFSTYKDNREIIDTHMFKLYNQIHEEFTSSINDSGEFLSNRNKDFVIILTTQFLQPLHAPTKIVLDIAHVHVSMGKQVMIVNTAESMGGITAELLQKELPISINDFIGANYHAPFCDINTYQYNDEEYPFFQFDNNMPDISSIKLFLDTVRKLKPNYIVSLTGNSPLADACSKLVPVICYPTGASVPYSHAHYHYQSRRCTPYDEFILKMLNKNKENVLIGLPIVKIDDSGETQQRAELNIPENLFLMAIVGNRLSSELDTDFLSVMNNIVSSDTAILFIGAFENQEEILGNYPNLLSYSYFCRYSYDLPATLSMCDLFINPIRSGGGTSAGMAIARGCPVVTTDYGDIPTIVGPDFYVNSLNDYAEIINKYKNSKSFYSEMSEKALQRASLINDGEKQYAKLFAQFEEIANQM